MRTSARNHFVGQIANVKTGDVSDEVTLRTEGGLDIVAVITRGSASALGLARSTEAFALVKASSVILLVDFDSSKVSARNCIPGTVSSVTKGSVNAEVAITAPGGTVIVAVITNDSVERLGLATGKNATAIFKASSVIIGVE
jgi:molybdate transport system regulatory protein